MSGLMAGMLILTLLSLCVCIGITILAYRKRDRSAGD